MAAAHSGDTVEIGPGTYTASAAPDGVESVVTHVSVIGAGPGGPTGTTIGGTSAVTAFELALSGAGSSASNLEVLIPSGASSVTGVFVNGSVTNVAVVAASGSSDPQGAQVDPGDSFTGSVDLSAASGASKLGIGLDGGTIAGSTIKGAQTGIEAGGNATITRTAISGATDEDVTMSDGGTLELTSSLLELGTPCGGGCAGVYVTDDTNPSHEVDLANIDQDTIVAGSTSGGAAAGWAVAVNGEGNTNSATAEIDSSVGVGFPAPGGGSGGNVECYKGTGGTGAVSIGYSSFNFTGMTGASGSITPACPTPTLTSNEDQGGPSPVAPVFVNAGADDYHLPYNSPLVDAGDPSLSGGTDLDGNARVVNGKTDIGAYEYQRGAPTVSASGPASATPGQSLGFQGSASDPNHGESISSYTWSFDDGTRASGAGVTHAYTTAGTHVATLTVTEPNGLSASATVTTVVALPAPVISGVSFIQAHFSGTRKHRKLHGAEISLQLSEAATVTMTLERAVRGREKNGTCLAATHVRRHLPKCMRYVPAGTVSVTLAAGPGTISPGKLHKGTYEAAIVAVASSGPASAPTTTTFHIR
jgi:hypothetical protein